MTEPALGFGLPVSGSWATAANLVAVARRADEFGYASLWAFQRLLHPAEGDWGPVYRSVQDPIVTLAHVAAVTEHARLGFAVVNAPFYAPILLAKQLTTLDQLSQGRLDVGLGLGWAAEEFTAAGVPYAHRGARTEEFIQCLQAIWTDRVVDFDGEFYRVPAAIVDPKPLQQPYPPLLLGGTAERALRRVGRLADGWISSSRHDLRAIGADIELIKAAATDAGRDPESMRFIVRGLLDLLDSPAADDDAGLAGDSANAAGAGSAGGDHQELRQPLHGTVEQIRADLRALAEQGVTEVFFDLNFDPRIGSPTADAKAAIRQADRVLEAFAPGRPAAG
ncbi:MAG: TIGR03619 family F420-dependent LLM class oxidoreductase [Actinomycetota bacterium]|nr:TIGR03619 family F420-dependent LLM class oxidoreductase [Actinomycetota bacterium]MDQ2956347.1 TIGR03619 family F420-dependent LLM class oxidoreductase [Actinomycetota bacterium]